VALAVAKQAQTENLADPMTEEAISAAIRAKMWEPVYGAYRRLPLPPSK
jgi:malic enzyme